MTQKFQIENSTKKVNGFSNFRLPFDPKDVALVYRNELRKYISNLQIGNNQILRVKYSTTIVGFFDIENILFYNVGASSFKNICKNGIIMEFEHKSNSTINDFDHIVEYQIIDVIPKLKSGLTKHVSNFDFKMAALKTRNRVSDYWFSMHSGAISLNHHHQNSINNFGLYIELETSKINFNIVGIMKSLVDGIISGYHIENNSDTIAEERISNMLDIEKKKITKLLLNADYGVLGKRNLVSSYRNSVKWNPADDKCKELTIYPKINNSIKNVRIKGFLYELS